MWGSSYQPMMMSGPVPRLAARAALGRTSSQVMYSTLTGTPVASLNFFVLAFHISSSDLTKPDQRKSRSDASFSGLKTGSLLAPWARAPPAASPTPHSSTVRPELLAIRFPRKSRAAHHCASRGICEAGAFVRRWKACAHGHEAGPGRGADAGRLHALVARRVRARQRGSRAARARAARDRDRGRHGHGKQ